MTHRITTSELRSGISEAMDRVEDPDGWLVITRHGRDAGALVSIPMLGRILRAQVLASGRVPAGLETKAMGATGWGDEARQMAELSAEMEALAAQLDAR